MSVDDDLLRWAYGHNVQWHCHLYPVTENPLFLWALYRNARAFKRPIPDEVLAYLDDCANSLLSLKPDPKRLGDEIQKAIGLRTGTRGRSYFRSRPDAEQRLAVMRSVFNRLGGRGPDCPGITFVELQQIFADTADELAPNGPAADTIQKWYYEDRVFFSNSGK